MLFRSAGIIVVIRSKKMLIKQFSFWCLVLDEVLSSIDIEEKFAFKPIAENTTQSTSGGFVPFLQNDGTYRYILENKDCICLAYKIAL